MRNFKIKIPEFIYFIEEMFSQLSGKHNIEYTIGYTKSFEESFPSWRYLTQHTGLESVDVSNLPIVVHIYFTGHNVRIDGERASIAAPQIDYKFTIDFLLPVDQKGKSEEIFWNRLNSILVDISNYSYRVINHLGIRSGIIHPISSSLEVSEPYTTYLDILCHMYRTNIKIEDVSCYGNVENNLYGAE